MNDLEMFVNCSRSAHVLWGREFRPGINYRQPRRALAWRHELRDFA